MKFVYIPNPSQTVSHRLNQVSPKLADIHQSFAETIENSKYIHQSFAVWKFTKTFLVIQKIFCPSLIGLGLGELPALF